MKRILINSCFLLLTAGAMAQTALSTIATESAKKDSRAQQRAEAYATALGLDDAQTAKLTSMYSEVNEKVEGMYKEKEAMQTRIDEMYAPYDAKVESMLTKEQLVKLEEMKKAGWTAGCCAPKEGAASGCAGHAKQAGGAGCCAGKAAAGEKKK
ncbi:MAG: hypothetical protein IPP83_02560 [Flavobacteriales bacterium]|nr:hypothetical protein [Flavobacteriales bacterium]